MTDRLVIEEFMQNWGKLSGKSLYVTHLEKQRTDIAEMVESLLPSGTRRVVVMGDAWPIWEEMDVASQLNGCEVLTYDESVMERLSKKEFVLWLQGACLSVTKVQWAAADTGTIAVYANGRDSMLPTLLPAAHLAVVFSNQIVPILKDGLQLMEKASPRMGKLITGPSMTADIEGELQIGVHGPGQVGVIIINV